MMGAIPFGPVGLLALISIIGVVSSAFLVARRRKGAATTTLEEIRMPKPSTEPSIPTGYAILDGMLGGGIPEGYAVLLISQSYDERDLLIRKTIKSILGSGIPTCYLSNDIARTRELTSRFSRDFYAVSPVADKILPQPPNLFQVPGVGDLSNFTISSNLLIERKADKTKSKLIVIDLLSDLLLRNKGLTTRKWLSDFVGKRKTGGFTIIATIDPSIAPREDVQAIVGVLDGIIEIFEKEVEGKPRRFLAIKKMYGREYSNSELALDIQQLL
jgi:KaiC/GvpD/RAD55 family RecA-like ATPase